MNNKTRFSGQQKLTSEIIVPPSRRALCLTFILVLVVLLAACSGNRNGSPSSAPASPAPVSSSAEVVQIRAANISLSAGGKVDAEVRLSISSGFHVNANPATFPYLIPTEVTPGKIDGLTAGPAFYPPAEKKKFQFAEVPLAVYEGDVLIKLPLRAEKNAATGTRSLPLAVRVQACDHEKCFPPATVNATIVVDVK